MPRLRWYFMLRENTSAPSAAIAEAMVSPSKPVTVFPFQVKDRLEDLSITSPGWAVSRLLMTPPDRGSRW